MTKQPLTPAEFIAARNAASALLALVGPTAAQLDDFRAYCRGDAIARVYADQIGPDHGKRVLTEAEFVMVCAVNLTVPSTPANNVWD